jgi:hypothetical protein
VRKCLTFVRASDDRGAFRVKVFLVHLDDIAQK